LTRGRAFRWLGVVEATYGPRRPPTPKLELRFLAAYAETLSGREDRELPGVRQHASRAEDFELGDAPCPVP
jgi:hypothetical protein